MSLHVRYTLSYAGNLLAGSFARSSVGALFMPITVLKVRYESHQYRYGSILDAARSIYVQDGWRGEFSSCSLLLCTVWIVSMSSSFIYALY